MGLLDELEQEAQRRKLSDAEIARRKAEREEAYRVRIEPALDALHHFLTELIAKLKTLQPRKRIAYHVPGYGDAVGYVEHVYELEDNKQASTREITLVFHCALATEECPSVDVDGASRVRAVAGFFQRHHIGGMLAANKDPSGEVISATFRAKGRIPLTAHFYADADTAALRMTFTNFDDLGTVVKTITPSQIDEDLYEQIGRYVMREANTLMREDLPEAYRNQLRSKIQQQQIKRRWESRISDDRETEIAELRRAYTASGRVGGLLDRVIGAGGALGRLRGLVIRRK